MAVTGWRTWSILQKNDEGKYGLHVATFATRTECRNYLKFKKEEHFFSTGSMEEAESMWNEDNFLIDYSLVVDRVSITNNFNSFDSDYTKWGSD